MISILGLAEALSITIKNATLSEALFRVFYDECRYAQYGGAFNTRIL